MMSIYRLQTSRTLQMLWVWIIESILLGLTGLIIVTEKWMVVSQLIIIGCTAVLHLFCLAWPINLHHEVSLSHLNAVTSLLLYSISQLDVNSVQCVTLFSWLVVLQTLALGMVFASKAADIATPLWLHPGSMLLLTVPLWLKIDHGFVSCLILSAAVLVAVVLPTTIQYIYVSLGSATLAVIMWTWWSILPGIVAIITVAAAVQQALQIYPMTTEETSIITKQTVKPSLEMFRFKSM